ncbi:MAG: hypothetical protein HY726_13115, partial [Candidatus Rokubacteria bacterium]|nr:hypothetical protein [Candidatus Rokubacteria bacterium]
MRPQAPETNVIAHRPSAYGRLGSLVRGAKRTVTVLFSHGGLPLLIALVTFAVFAPALRNGFVDWDDNLNIVKNPDYRGLGWKQLQWMFTTTLLYHWIPLTWMTFGLDYLVWGMNPFGYHLTNLLLHAANAALFFLLA